MGAELISVVEKSVHVSEMQDGQLAVITGWSINEDTYKGTIVQRYGEALINLGKNSGNSYSLLFKNEGISSSCKVRILEDGELIKVTNNQ